MSGDWPFLPVTNLYSLLLSLRFELPRCFLFETNVRVMPGLGEVKDMLPRDRISCLCARKLHHGIIGTRFDHNRACFATFGDEGSCPEDQFRLTVYEIAHSGVLYRSAKWVMFGGRPVASDETMSRSDGICCSWTGRGSATAQVLCSLWRSIREYGDAAWRLSC